MDGIRAFTVKNWFFFVRLHFTEPHSNELNNTRQINEYLPPQINLPRAGSQGRGVRVGAAPEPPRDHDVGRARRLHHCVAHGHPIHTLQVSERDPRSVEFS